MEGDMNKMVTSKGTQIKQERGEKKKKTKEKVINKTQNMD